MAQTPPDKPRDDSKNAAPGDPGESLDHYELADHPDEMDDGPPPAVPSKPRSKPTPNPSDTASPDVPAPPNASDPAAPVKASPGQPVRCPHCDEKIIGTMLGGNCPKCGKRISQPTTDDEQSTKHANAALALGILSIPLGLTCLGLLGTIFGSVLGAILGGVAVHFARQAKQEIAEGHAPPTSEGAANLGYLCGIIGVVLGCALTLFYTAMQLIAFALEF